VRAVTLALAAGCAVLLSGCDASSDFVIGRFENAGHQFVLVASSGPSGEDASGTLTVEGTLFGRVGCLQVDGAEARVGIDLSPSIGLTSLAVITGNGSAANGIDVISQTPSGHLASDVCDADLEPGPAQPGSFFVHDAAAP
jgi:hypothetical protein